MVRGRCSRPHEAHGDCALAGSFAVLTLLQGDGLSVAELQRQVEDLA